ncbi:hypothetical protein F750_5610 [Streptomyces sp. PAMC 26508]|nr:hypothetical protein F750_5610 [Streptomyces sp. PAMC 26508]
MFRRRTRSSGGAFSRTAPGAPDAQVPGTAEGAGHVCAGTTVRRGRPSSASCG